MKVFYDKVLDLRSSRVTVVVINSGNLIWFPNITQMKEIVKPLTFHWESSWNSLTWRPRKIKLDNI